MIIEKHKNKKYDFNYVNKYFKENECKLLSKEYKRNDEKLDYICKCGNFSQITFSCFKKGQRCKQCAVSKTKHTFDYVKQYFSDNGCELLEDKYINSSISMKYICICGEFSKICFNNFKQGKRCKKCGKNKPYTQDEVIEHFKSKKCELLDTYLNYKTNMKYKCSCGNISEISLSNFNKGHRCKVCGFEKISGNNHYLWIDDRDKVRELEKLQDMSSSYKKAYRKKYNIPDEYHIDHIFPIAAFRDYDIYDLDFINLEENLQPLLPIENLSKGSKYNKKKFEKYLRNKDYKIYIIKDS